MRSKSMNCFLCHQVVQDAKLENHMNLDHLVVHDLDLLLLIQNVDEKGKYEIKKFIQHVLKTDPSRFEFSQKADEIDAVDNSLKCSGSSDGKKTEAHSVLNYDEDESPLSSKLSFWEDVTGVRGRSNPVNISIARKSFRNKSTESSLLRKVVSKKFSPTIGLAKSNGLDFDVNYNKTSHSEKKRVNPAYEPAANMRSKSANDTIEVFDDVFESNCVDFNDSIDGVFGRLVDEVNLVDESIVERKYEQLEVSLRTKDVRHGVSGTSMEEEKYICPKCSKSFKFLTFLKVHMSSKILCT